MKPEPNFTWEEMDKVREKYVRPLKPDGAFTVQEYAERYKLAKTTARRELAKLLSEGVVELVRIPGKKGKLTEYYRGVSNAHKQAKSV